METDSHTHNQRPVGLPKPAYIIHTHVHVSETKVAQNNIFLPLHIWYTIIFYLILSFKSQL